MPAKPQRAKPKSSKGKLAKPRANKRRSTRTRSTRTRSTKSRSPKSPATSLREYKAKRDFTRTPEPVGDTTRVAKSKKNARKGLFFCVQKHLASQLHYDFRLEHNGVLLSWAVPKGPSLKPGDKRLAMQTEDHPLDYGEFEGVIPEGYGAGIVMLWDRGTWKPEVDDVDAAIEKGDLKFALEGVKLKGSWVLVRTRAGPYDARGRSRSWLLIKHRDQWAGDVNVLEVAPDSVKSFGDFTAILAQDTPAVWDSHRPGGAVGKMLREIIEKAATVRADREMKPTPARSGRRQAT